jgi:hypothetical protein
MTATEIKLKAGCKYRTKLGTQVHCYGPKHDDPQWFVVALDGEAAAYLVNELGMCFNTNLDIVDEWREPRTWIETITVFDGGMCSPCQTLGKVSGSIKVLARKTVTLTEGEGV